MPPLAAGFEPDQGQHGGAARGERGQHPAHGAPLPDRPETILRFIEYMDVGSTNGWRLDDVVPAGEIITRVNKEFPLEALDANYPGEVARRYRYRMAPARSG